MTAERPAPARTVDQWLDALIEAEPRDRRMVSIDGIGVGLALERVHCERCNVALNWLSAFSHLDRSEASYRLQHGTGMRLHQPGDLRVKPERKHTTACRRCRRSIIWAVTSTGAPLPVDALPTPEGNVVLAQQPSGVTDDRPLALFLHTDADRAQTSAAARYPTHVCKPAARARRSR